MEPGSCEARRMGGLAAIRGSTHPVHIRSAPLLENSRQKGHLRHGWCPSGAADAIPDNGGRKPAEAGSLRPTLRMAFPAVRTRGYLGTGGLAICRRKNGTGRGQGNHPESSGSALHRKPIRKHCSVWPVCAENLPQRRLAALRRSIVLQSCANAQGWFTWPFRLHKSASRDCFNLMAGLLLEVGPQKEDRSQDGQGVRRLEPLSRSRSVRKGSAG